MNIDDFLNSVSNGELPAVESINGSDSSNTSLKEQTYGVKQISEGLKVTYDSKDSTKK